jgi:hypothetical protein
LYLNTQNLARKEEDKEQEKEKEKENEKEKEREKEREKEIEYNRCSTEPVDEEVKEDEKAIAAIATDTLSAPVTASSSSSSFSSPALLQINTTQTPSRRGRLQDKKYLQLPAGAGLYGTDNQVDFSLDLSYQKLLSKLQEGKDKLRKLLSTHMGGDDCNDVFTNSRTWSFDAGNFIMKKYLFNMTEEERCIIQIFLAALRTHNLSLCNNLATDPSAWQR